MPPIYPSPLHPGARIAVTAASSGVLPALHPRLDLVVGHLRTQGFDVVEDQCLRGECLSASAPPDAPAAELMHLLMQSTLGGLACPVLVDIDIGHRPLQWVFVNGALAEVQWSRRGGGTVRQRLS